jgi:hypothetical protein
MYFTNIDGLARSKKKKAKGVRTPILSERFKQFKKSKASISTFSPRARFKKAPQLPAVYQGFSPGPLPRTAAPFTPSAITAGSPVVAPGFVPPVSSPPNYTPDNQNYVSPTEADTGRDEFMQWLENDFPKLNTLIDMRADKFDYDSVDGIGAGETDWGTKVLDIIKSAVPVIQQQKIFSTQLKRAKQGLPLLKTSELTPPGIPIQVQLPDDVQAAISRGVATGKNALLFGGAALLAVMLLSKLRKKGA